MSECAGVDVLCARAMRRALVFLVSAAYSIRAICVCVCTCVRQISGGGFPSCRAPWQATAWRSLPLSFPPLFVYLRRCAPFVRAKDISKSRTADTVRSSYLF